MRQTWYVVSRHQLPLAYHTCRSVIDPASRSYYSVASRYTARACAAASGSTDLFSRLIPRTHWNARRRAVRVQQLFSEAPCARCVSGRIANDARSKERITGSPPGPRPVRPARPCALCSAARPVSLMTATRDGTVIALLLKAAASRLPSECRQAPAPYSSPSPSRGFSSLPPARTMFGRDRMWSLPRWKDRFRLNLKGNVKTQTEADNWSRNHGSCSFIRRFYFFSLIIWFHNQIG